MQIIQDHGCVSPLEREFLSRGYAYESLHTLHFHYYPTEAQKAGDRANRDKYGLASDARIAYTLYQRLKEDSGGNFEAGPMTSGQFTTEYTSVNPDDLTAAINPQTTPYTGSPIAYQVPAISHVTKSTVTYSVDGETTTAAPTDAGTYPVTVSFTMQAGAAQLEDLTSTLTITKISQNAPSAPRAGSVGTNSITVASIPGAVFSIDVSIELKNPVKSRVLAS